MTADRPPAGPQAAAQTDRLLPDDGRPISPLGSDFELPPDDMVEQLDNQAPAKAPALAAKPAAALDFVDAAVRVYPLARPFRHEGRIVEAITLRRLTVSEIGRLRDVLGEGLDRYDLYGLMAGLPAEVMRGLDADDLPVVEAAYDFLPRFMKDGD
ncbi:phage tail assembly protein [Prosthecodimorpha staleyi]|uniref:Phage tail assembly protein n=1 Tax=Prosthecodimorpha staleyi TaxID=2840188 RepID=A0A947DAA6_9HYPH|nr:phage tail assembly protein [Prosthecodimorpha staleyi]MBT9293304.1 phage tail assembly protein [Prosthecodimorpha staleyi]